MIFQSFSSVLGYFLYLDTGDNLNQWLSSFIVWANSDILYEIWKKNKFIYDETSRNFIDYIFEQTRSNPPKNNNDIAVLADSICNSEMIAKLFDGVDKDPPCKKYL